MSKRTERQSNIELLRMIAACGVIILHYNNADIGGGFKAVAQGSLNQGIMMLIEVLFIGAVNLFVLISGYFMRDSMKRDFLKPIELLAQWVLFGGISVLLKELPSDQPLTFVQFMTHFTATYWFVFVYIALYLISPYLNLIWSKLTEKGKNTLLAVWFCVFSAEPFLIEVIQYYTEEAPLYGTSTVGILGSQYGYTIVIFVMMYLLGMKLRDKCDAGWKFGAGKSAALLAINTLLLFFWTYLEHFLTEKELNMTTAWNYDNPLVISEAVFAFLLFRNLNIRHSKVINGLAAASFPSYLIHVNFLEYIGIEKAVTWNPALLVLHMFGTTIAIYLVSYAVYLLYQLLIAPIFKAIGKKWTKHRGFTVGV